MPDAATLVAVFLILFFFVGMPLLGYWWAEIRPLTDEEQKEINKRFPGG